MKVLIALALLGTVAAWLPNPYLDEEWEQFKALHNKKYESYSEELMRRLIFEENHRFIEEHNTKGEYEFTLGMNHFGDLTNKEYRETYLGYKRPKNSQWKPDYIFSKADNVEHVPDQIDWRDHGYVTPIKDQGQCGSCWAFSAVGSLEGQHFKSTGKLVSLSEQNLVDCSYREGNHGCNGGWMDYAFEYVKDNRGIDTEDSYPYLGTQRPCHFKNKTVGATATGFVDVREGDEEALRQAVGTTGPVSVAIDASSSMFLFYSEGVYNNPGCSNTSLDHAVLVVGYGKQFQEKDFWMVKNSWGIGWGNNGYIEMSRNKENQCGIATKASFPKV